MAGAANLPSAKGSPVENSIQGLHDPERLDWRSISTGFLVISLTVAIAGVFIYRSAKSSVTHAITNSLQVIATLKATQVDHWLDEKKQDIRSDIQDAFARPELATNVQQWLLSGMLDATLSETLRGQLRQLDREHHYLETSLHSARDGSLLLASEQEVDKPQTRTLALASLKTGEPTLEDFHFEGAPGEHKLHIGFLIAVSLGKTHPIRLVVDVTLDASEVLFPMIQHWPGWDNSAETLLLRRDGHDALVLNSLHSVQDSALRLRFPDSALQTIPAQALRVGPGVLHGIGLRNEPAIAYVVQVPDTPWTLVAVVDEKDAYAKLNTITALIAAIVVLLLLSGAWWLVEHNRNTLTRMRHELDRRLLTSRINYLAKYANDCIMLCDAIGRIIEVNDRCLSTYGHTKEEFLDMNLSDLRTPASRWEIPKLLERIAEGDGLIYESEHQTRNGMAFPVEISANLVYIDGVSFYQAIIRDLTTRRKLEEERVEHLLRVSELSRRLVTVQEEERRELSAELHDRIGANLATINMNLRGISNALPAPRPPRVQMLLTGSGALLADTIASIREFCADLRPALLDYSGLAPALQELVNQFGQRTGIATSLQLVNMNARLPAETESLLYRIAQEAMLNCAKHAGAGNIEVGLEQQERRILMTIRDDGSGFDPDGIGRSGQATGLGLLTMRERAELAGGRLTLLSSPGGGTLVKVELETRAEPSAFPLTGNEPGKARQSA